MSLDGSLPGYFLHRRDGGEVELMNKHTRKIVYRAFRAPGVAYDCVLEDALLQSPLARSTAASTQVKSRSLELFNPDVEVAGGLKQTGRVSYTWQFQFGGETFEYRQPRLSSKEFTLFLLRQPDPPVDLARFAITPTASSWKGGAELTLQQYNIDRFDDIADPKGFEVLAVLGFIGFWDAFDDRANGGRPAEVPRPPVSSSGASTAPLVAATPPVPEKDTNELVGWQDFEDPPNPNEIPLSHHAVPTLAARAFDLLKDPSMLFVVLKARSPEEIAKGVKVIEEVGRLRLRRWDELEVGSEMHQYIVEEKPRPPSLSASRPPPPPPPVKQPPRTINLDSEDRLSAALTLSPHEAVVPRRTPSTSQPWDKTPPQALSFYLSKIVLPDLQPKSSSSSSVAASPPPARDGSGRPSGGPSLPRPPSRGSHSASAGSSQQGTPVISSSPPPSAENEGRMDRLMREGFGRLGLRGSSGGSGSGAR